MKSGTDGLAGAPHDLDRQAHPVGVRAAPAVGAPVGVGDQELVDEVALGAHDLDAVVAGLAGQHRAVHEGLDLALDAALAQRPGGERRDRALDPRRRHDQRVVAVATGVQDLQGDVAALGVHGLGDRAVLAGRRTRGQRAGAGLGPALDVRREAAGHDQADAAAGALGEVVGEVPEPLGIVLEPGVHRAHEHAVAQGGEAQVEGSEQVRVGRGGIRVRHGPSVDRPPRGRSSGSARPDRDRSSPRIAPRRSVGWATMIDFDEVLATNSTRFREVLAGVPDAARVPSCPDWSAADLLWHLTEVQSFWATIVADRACRPTSRSRRSPRPRRPAGRDAALTLFDAVSGRLRAGPRRRPRRRAGLELDGEPHDRLDPASAGAGGAGPPRRCRAHGRAAQRDRLRGRRGRGRRAAQAVRRRAARRGARSIRRGCWSRSAACRPVAPGGSAWGASGESTRRAAATTSPTSSPSRRVRRPGRCGPRGGRSGPAALDVGSRRRRRGRGDGRPDRAGGPARGARRQHPVNRAEARPRRAGAPWRP